MTWVVKSVACTGIPLVFTGSMNLIVKEEDLLESLELISQRLGYEAPSTAWSNFSARQQQNLQQQQQQHGQDTGQHHVLKAVSHALAVCFDSVNCNQLCLCALTNITLVHIHPLQLYLER